MARVLVPKAPGSPWMVYREVDEKTGEIAPPTPEPGVTETEVRVSPKASASVVPRQDRGPGGLLPVACAGPRELALGRKLRIDSLDGCATSVREMEQVLLNHVGQVLEGNPRLKHREKAIGVLARVMDMRQQRQRFMQRREIAARKYGGRRSGPQVSLAPRGQ